LEEPEHSSLEHRLNACIMFKTDPSHDINVSKFPLTTLILNATRNHLNKDGGALLGRGTK